MKNSNLKICLLVTTFLIPFYFLRFSISGIPTNIFEIAVLASALYFIVLRFTLHVPRFMLGHIWPYLLILFAALSVFAANDRASALGIFKGWFLVPVVYYLLITNVFRRKELTQLAVSMYFSLIVVSLWAVLERLGGIGLHFYQKTDLVSFQPYLDQGRAFGPFESPNYLAMFVVPAMFLSFLVYQSVKNKTGRLIITLSYFLPLLSLYLSGSRGGILALIFSLLLVLLLFSIRKKNLAPTLLLLLLAFLFVAGAYQFNKISSTNRDSSNSVRLEIYNYSVEILRQAWLKGVGLGGFYDSIGRASSNDQPFQVYNLPYALHPHNLFLAIWLNLGFFGFLVFLILLIIFYRKSLADIVERERYFIAIISLAAMTSILIHGLVDTTYFKNDLAALFWFVFAIPFLSKGADEKSSISN